MNMGMRNIPDEVSSTAAISYFSQLMQGPALALLPIAVTGVVIGLIANFVQVGFVLSGEPMVPNLQKVDPFKGFQRLFSRRSVFEGAKAAAKSCIFGYAAWSGIVASWPTLVGLSFGTPLAAVATVGGLIHGIFLRVAIAWLVLAALDYFFQRKQTNKQIMMTKQELKQEMKEMEGSPEVKAQMMQRRRKLVKGRMMDAVKKADVIVTNPTHYSVAIQYEQGKMPAPIVVAKGQDLIALKIREVAAEHRIPIVPNPPLARQLYKKCEIGDVVPRELFQAVAEVLAYVYRTLKRVRQ
jgi:flagellar biosynthesis protein FlhB